MVKSKEAIDKELSDAWEAEVANNPAQAYIIYKNALNDLIDYRNNAPREDYENLTSLLLSYLLSMLSNK